MGLFEDIPVRSNFDTAYVEASWWNTIRTALVSAFPGVTASSTAFTIANNQSSYANITGFILDSATYTRYKWRYRIQRSDDTPDVRDEIGTMSAKWDGSAWSYIRTIEEGNALGDGVEGGETQVGATDAYYIVPATGQVQYKSSNMTGGTYVGKHEYKILETWSV